jgi:hypothetical protein
VILIFEQDVREHDGRRFDWRPELFRGRWEDRRNWRLSWGLWSISYYPSPGLRAFMDHIESGNTVWQGGDRP